MTKLTINNFKMLKYWLKTISEMQTSKIIILTSIQFQVIIYIEYKRTTVLFFKQLNCSISSRTIFSKLSYILHNKKVNFSIYPHV